MKRNLPKNITNLDSNDMVCPICDYPMIVRIMNYPCEHVMCYECSLPDNADLPRYFDLGGREAIGECSRPMAAAVLDHEVDVIWALAHDSTLKGQIKVTILATGFNVSYKSLIPQGLANES